MNSRGASVLGALTIFVLAGAALGQDCASACPSIVKVAGVGAECDDATRPADFAQNLFTYTTQRTPSVARLHDGRLVTVWASRRQEASTYGIFARLSDASGVPISDEIHVNAYMPSAQTQPAVSAASDGTVWFAWSSLGQDGDQNGVIARRFRVVGETLEAISDEIAVNGERAGDQSSPSIATLGDGRTMIVWTHSSAGGRMVMGRVFDSSGSPVAGEFVLAGDDALLGSSATVVRAGEGFAVAWGGLGEGNRPAGIFLRRFDRNGGSLGGAIEIVPGSVVAIEPSIDADADGNLVIAYLTAREEGGYDVRAQRVLSTGELAGDAILVARGGDAWKSGASVAMSDDGRFVVSYTSDTGPIPEGEARPEVPTDVLAVRFDRQGVRESGAVRVHAMSDGRQASEPSPARRAVWGSAQDPIFVWEGRTERDGSGIALSTMVPEGFAIARGEAREAMEIIGYEEVARSALIPPIFDQNWVAPPPDGDVRPQGVDFGFQAWNGTGWTPPDPDLSVGPNTIVGVVNVEIKIFTKSGQQLFVQDLVPFFSPVGANGFLFDPVALFDRHSNRHIVCVVEHTSNQTSWINIAVSKTSDPQNGNDWWKYRFNTTTPTGGARFIDYQNLGVDEEAISVAADYFSGTGGNWIHLFEKAPMLSGQATTMRLVQTSGGFRSLGSTNHIDADAPGLYFVSSFSSPNTIALDAITNANTNPVRSTFNLSVPAFSQPPGAAQQGSSNRISTVDQRIKNGVYRNGSLWLTHNIGIDSVAQVRYYEVAMRGWPTSGLNPQLVQSGEIDLGPGIYTFFGDPGVDDDNNLILQFNRSSSAEFVNIQRTFRLAGDAPGTVREPVLVQSSNSPDNSGRWGDYSGMDEDPSAPSVFWGHDEYVINQGWRTWIGQINLNDALPDIEFVFPSGIPEFIDPSGETIRVEVVATDRGEPQPGTGVLFYDLEQDGTYVSVPMNQVSPNVYDANLPAVPCLEEIDYYFAADSTLGETFTSPQGAPDFHYTSRAVVDNVIALQDNFETDLGWITENLGATAGQWQRGVPVNDPGWEHDPAQDGDGSGQCYLTQNTTGNSDVDAGSVRLTSPVLDLSADGDFSITYFYYLRLTRPDAEDGMLVEVSDNDLVGPWRTIIDHRGDGGTTWRTNSITEAQLVNAGLNITDRMRIRFTARDNDPQSIVEAGIDGVVISALTCSDAGCAADLDGDGDADGDDFFRYLDAFASGNLTVCDLDRDGDCDADDFFAYLDVFASGC